MADEELTLRMRSRGSREVERDVDRVGRSVRRIGSDSRTGNRNVNLFTRAITVMGTRAGIATFIVLGLGVAVAATSPAIALLTAGLAAAGAVMIPMIGLMLGLIAVFSATKGVAGSAGSELVDVLAEVKAALLDMITPGANLMMRAISNTLVALLPVLHMLKPAFTVLGKAMAQAITVAGNALVAMAPALVLFIREAAHLMPTIVSLTLGLLTAFVHLGVAGIPVLEVLLGWLTSFAWWLVRAIDNMQAFFSSAAAAHVVNTVFADVAAAAEYVAHNVATLAQIAYQLWQDLQPLVSLLAIGLLGALRLNAGLLDFVNQHLADAKDLVVPLATGFLAWKAGIVAVNIAMTAQKALMVTWLALSALMAVDLELLAAATVSWGDAWALLTLLMETNVFVIILTAVVALAAGIIYAYHHSEKFRSIVQGLLHALQAAAQWAYRAGIAIKNFLGGAFQWVADKADALLKKVRPIVSVAKKIAGFTPLGLAAKGLGKVGIHVPHLAGGGQITRGGIATVGERGREDVLLPAGAQVIPNDHRGGSTLPDDFAVEATFILPDGTLVAKQVVRASRKKKAVS